MILQPAPDAILWKKFAMVQQGLLSQYKVIP